ncbi:WhiB family transcriptional regulator [Kitasatospora kifunensis]|uniref:4Fe-4S Wbl-type domain-containing protein n=1 Tax=Kitasatospora kifunensis TaxID=58351 RepID=A0A7W7QZT8_KITKI|nr:WhiB family transcriptional regulator [Kitasatospora kifunensis]MBB4922151.1 hypothetical protein [Kitasatospora kifunensis]
MAQARVFEINRPALRGLCDLDDSHVWDAETEPDRDYAKRVCGHCPIEAACLTNALEEEGSSLPAVRAGVRGGLTPQERHALWRRIHRTDRKAAA